MQTESGVVDGPPRRAVDQAQPPALLDRVRRLFTVLAGALLLAEVVELVDADTSLWPDRALAAVGLLAATVLVVVVRRRGWPLPAGDGVAVAAVFMVGTGLGRVGAVLALLLGLGILRSLFGSRRSVVVAFAGLMVAYGGVAVALDGPVALLDLNYVVVGLGLAGFSWVVRHVGEAIARHDVGAAWDEVLALAAHRLLRVEDPEQIEQALADAVATLDARDRGDDLIAVPRARGLDPDVDLPAGVDELTASLHGRLRRLWTDARLARSLLASEARYRRLAEDSRDGIYLRTARTVTSFPYVNAAGRELLGALDRPGAPGIDLGMVHPDDRRDLVDWLKTTPCDDQPLRVRLHPPDTTDDLRWLEITETPVTWDDGELATVQGTVRDVTAARQHEAALRSALEREQQAAEQLRAVDEMRATFLAAISHELRTPLAGLVGASQTLAARDGRLTREQIQELSQVVQRQADRVVRLLDDLVDVERLSRGRMGIDPRPVSLLALARGVAAGFEADEHRLVVGGDDVVLTVDHTHVERILHNLVRNALKHAPSATEVRVAIGAREDGAVLVVEDDGPGIPASMRDWLFEPFVHGPTARRSPSPGAGIGLSLVSKFAELHGGRAWVEESASGGARFVVLLGDVLADEPAPAVTS